MPAMFRSSSLDPVLAARSLLAAASLQAIIAGLPFALLTQGERANEQSQYSPVSNKRRL
jgi:hypothetical protein